MAVSAGEVEATLRLKNEMTAELQKALKPLTDMQAELRSLSERADAASERLSSGMKQVRSDMQSASSAASTFKAAFAAMFSFQAIEAGVRIFAEFTSGVLEFAGKVQDLAAETGASTERIQALNYVAASASVTIDQVARAAEQLAKRIASDDKSAARGVQRLGLDLQALQQMRPDEMFLKVGQAIAGIENPTTRVQTAIELFGREGARMTRMFTTDMEKVVKEIESSGKVVDDNLIQAADKFSDAWTEAWMRFRAGIVNAIGKVSELKREFQLTMGTGGTNSSSGGVIGSVPATVRSFLSVITGQGGSVGATLNDANRAFTWAQGRRKGPSNPFAGGALDVNGLPDDDEMKKILKQSETLYGKAGDQIESDAAKKKREETAAAEKAAAALERLTKSVSEFNSDIFRQGAAVDASGGWFKAFAPDQRQLAAMGLTLPNISKVTPSMFNLMPPGMGGGNNVSVSGPQGFFASQWSGIKSAGSSAWSSLKDMISPGNLVSGLATGGLNMLGGLAIKGIGALVGKIFGGGEGAKVNDMRDDFIEKNFGSSDKLREVASRAGVSLDSFFHADKVKEFEAAVKSLTGSLNDFDQGMAAREQKQQMLNDAVSRYNFTLEEKGPLLQQQEMAKQAELLITDWSLLSEAGVNMNAVIREMAPAINEFVQHALATGTEVPMAMQAMIETLIENGLLLDENGVAYKDLEDTGLQFGETLSKMFEHVLEKLDEMIDKLGKATGLLSDVSSGAANLPAIPDYGGPQGSWTPEGEFVPGFAGGTGGAYPDFGSGTLVELHGRERVMTESEGRAEAGSRSELRGLRADIARFTRTMPIAIRDAILQSR